MSRRRNILELIQSFWGRVDTSGECWLWTGEVNNKGYGVFKIYEGTGREKLLAHRFSAVLAGMPAHSPADVVMHSCDTPRCVNPEHLSIGTQLDNIRDAKTKDRMDLSGLTADTLHECRECGSEFYGLPQRRYCSDSCATDSRRRKSVEYRRTYAEKQRQEGVA